MKKSLIILVLAVLLFSPVLSNAQGDENTIHIKTPKFVSPLLEKWIEEYTNAYPHIQIKQVSEKEQEADLTVAIPEGSKTLENVTWVSRYALLPVTTTSNPALDQLTKKKLGKKEIKGLFFTEDFLTEESDAKKLKYQDELTIYSANNSLYSSTVFARHFGYSSTDLRGKKISGDDIFLLNALKKDHSGVTFNNLGYLFDVNSRKLKENLVILPLDVKKEAAEILQSTNVDQLLTLLENQKVDLIPVENIGLVVEEDAPENVNHFLSWILSEGQKHNHTYGFLQLDKSTLDSQKKQLEQPLLSKHP